MALHELACCFGVGGVEFDCFDFAGASEPLYPLDRFAQSLLVIIGKGDFLDLIAAGQVECRGPTHHACSHNQNSHEDHPE